MIGTIMGVVAVVIIGCVVLFAYSVAKVIDEILEELKNKRD